VKPLKGFRARFAQDYDSICGEKRMAAHVATLLAVRHQVLAAGRAYLRATPHLEQVAPLPLPAPVANALYRSYLRRSPSVAAIHGRLIKKQDAERRAQCQYCCIGPPATLDHYLGRKTYPEFSVYSRNLVPSCHECNNPRLSIRANVRHILHLFDDPIGALPRILAARFDWVGGDPRIVFVLQPPARARRARVIDVYLRHCRTLRLLRRYETWAAAELQNERSHIRSHQGKRSDADIAKCYADQSTEDAMRLGLNHPKVALLDAIGADLAFVRWARQP
jgi:hypothetical protein